MVMGMVVEGQPSAPSLVMVRVVVVALVIPMKLVMVMVIAMKMEGQLPDPMFGIQSICHRHQSPQKQRKMLEENTMSGQ